MQIRPYFSSSYCMMMMMRFYFHQLVALNVFLIATFSFLVFTSFHHEISENRNETGPLLLLLDNNNNYDDDVTPHPNDSFSETSSSSSSTDDYYYYNTTSDLFTLVNTTL